MTKLLHDPLLVFARFLLMFFIVVLAIACAAMLIALPAVLIFQGEVLAQLAEQDISADGQMIAGLMALLAGIAALAGLGIYFLVLLRRIVNSVGEGDPFAPVNADRLTLMGWIAVISELASIPIAALGAWIEGIGGEANDSLTFDVSFDGGGIGLILVLFILARVFRKGAEMREDLEGTV
jgi:hypothetical protein